MNNQEFIEMNKKGWNDLIKANKPFSNTILPEYGPFLKRNEDEINVLDNLKDSKILDIGCGFLDLKKDLLLVRWNQK